MSEASTLDAESPVQEPEGSYTVALGDFIATSRGLAVPDELLAWMKLVTLDALGCGLLGSELEWTRRVRETLLETEGSGSALLWGTDDRVSAAHAAMVNGSAVQGFELDDVGPGSHFGSVTVPVALALADDGARLSGLDLLRATVTGVEVGARVSDCVGRIPHVECGFHGPGLFGAFAAAATAAYCLGLDSGQCVSTIGNVAQFTGGLMGVHHGGMGKRLLAGKAAHSGVLAAQLARRGFTNVGNIFECGYGSFPTAFSGGRSDTVRLERLTDGLGTNFRAYLIKFKFWAARGPIHPSLECIRILQAANGFRAADVEHVDIAIADASFKAVGFPYRPTSPTSAQMNLQYCLAMMLLDGEVFIDQFAEHRLREPAVLELVSRISVRHDPRLDENATTPKPRDTTVEVTLRDGTVLRQRENRYLLSFGEDPNASERVIAKFRRSTAGHVSESSTERIIELCLNLEQVSDIRELSTLLGRSGT
ncbi:MULTISPECIES: MmgE/PrpD family protein [unclassified Mycobacterium]|uniref:MmgE/PrpD family protein n=1 Tax=unclassified Mycobacterium TaxID=2642494 RepID=UPI0029C98D37|nr:MULTISPECIES: MmgE/PrpD family protein [unclassified Mycobacterium]